MIYIRLFEFLDELYVLVCSCMFESLEVYRRGLFVFKHNNKVKRCTWIK